MDGLKPKGKKVARIEAVGELEIGCAIDLYARLLSGVGEDADIPTGFKGQAVREMIVIAAGTVPGLAAKANAMAERMRTEQG